MSPYFLKTTFLMPFTGIAAHYQMSCSSGRNQSYNRGGCTTVPKRVGHLLELASRQTLFLSLHPLSSPCWQNMIPLLAHRPPHTEHPSSWEISTFWEELLKRIISHVQFQQTLECTWVLTNAPPLGSHSCLNSCCLLQKTVLTLWTYSFSFLEPMARIMNPTTSES